jgi:uncharacterized RDD family membrane protein YckC
MIEYDEEYDPSETYELASIGSRFVASLIDGILLSFTVGLVVAIVFRNNVAISMILYFAYFGYFWTQRDGQTLGKQAMDIKIIKMDGSPITWTDALVRYIGSFISSLALGLGYIWAIFDENNQTWHDKMAKTYVVNVKGKKKKHVTI